MKKPDITAVTVVPSSISARGTVKVSIAVTDKEIMFHNITEYAGEKYAGQEIGVM